MPSLLQNLLLDLRRRGNFVLSELGALDGKLPVDFERHRSEAVQRIERAIGLVDQILGDPDIGSPQLEPNFFMDFKRLSELVLNIEDSARGGHGEDNRDPVWPELPQFRMSGRFTAKFPLPTVAQTRPYQLPINSGQLGLETDRLEERSKPLLANEINGFTRFC